MMYQGKFVLTILVDNKVQKDKDGKVQLPFGAQYGVRLRNKHDRRAVCKLSIDGENVSEGGFIIPANDFVDILTASQKDAAFLFTSIDSEAAYDHGKNELPTSLRGEVRAEFALEREYIQKVIRQSDVWTKSSPSPSWPSVSPTCSTGGVTTQSAGGQSLRPMSMLRGMSFAPETKTSGGMDFADMDGCTVEGGRTGQRFRSVSFDAETATTTLTLRLVGIDETEFAVKQKRKADLISEVENLSMAELLEVERILKEKRSAK